MNSKNTYWIMTTEFPPAHGGGISTYASIWSKTLTGKGKAVTIFLYDPACNRKERISQIDNIRIIRFSKLFVDENIPLGNDAMVSYAFYSIVRKYIILEGAPAVLESQEYNGIAYFVLLFKHLEHENFSNLYIEIVCHAPSFLYAEINRSPLYLLPNFWVGEMERFCMRSADNLIFPSQYLLDKIASDLPIQQKKIKVLHNPFPVLFEEEIKQETINPKQIVFYGKLSPIKGIFELLSYFEKIWQKDRAFSLILIGGDDYFYYPEENTCGNIIRAKYKNEIRSGNLVLTGKISQQSLQLHLKSAALVVIPSIIDNFPYTVLECMANGKIVLVSSNGGQKEIITNGSNGFIFDHNKKGDFQDKIEHILSINDEERTRIRKKALDTVRDKCNPAKYYDKRMLEQSLSIEENSQFPYIRPIKKAPSLSLPSAQQPLKHLLSIIIPYYNLPEYIEETLESIHLSDYKDIEVIIVNDGSTYEDAEHHIDLLAKKFMNTSVIHKENEGLSIARNTGAALAKGEYLSFIDADDKVDKSYFSKSIKVLEAKSNVSFVGSWTKYFGDSNSIWPCFTPEPPFLLIHNMTTSGSLVYKRNDFLSAGLNDPSFIFGMEDYDNTISMISKGYQGVVIPEVLFFYRIRRRSMARKLNRNKILYNYQIIAKKHADLYNKFAPEISSLLNSNGPGYKFDNPTLDNLKLKEASFKLKMLYYTSKLFNRNQHIKQFSLKILYFIKSKIK